MSALAGFHTYKEPKTLSLFFHGFCCEACVTIADGVALFGRLLS